MIDQDEAEHIRTCLCCQAGLKFDLPEAVVDLLHIKDDLAEVGIQIVVSYCPPELVGRLQEALEYIALCDKSETRH